MIRERERERCNNFFKLSHLLNRNLRIDYTFPNDSLRAILVKIEEFIGKTHMRIFKSVI